MSPSSVRAILVFGAVVCALVVAGAAAGTAKVIAQGARLKGTNVWYGQGKAYRPATISAKVVPVPAQPVKVQWSIVCQKPNKDDPSIHLDATGKSGETTVRTVATVRLELPYAKPPACVATVYATLARKGALTLRVLQT